MNFLRRDSAVSATKSKTQPSLQHTSSAASQTHFPLSLANLLNHSSAMKKNGNSNPKQYLQLRMSRESAHTSHSDSMSKRSQKGQAPGKASGAGPPEVSTSTEADPLSIYTAAIGLVAATNRTVLEINRINAYPTDTTAGINAVLNKLSSFNAIVQRLYKILRQVEAGNLELAQRASLVDVDVVIVLLTASIMTISDVDAQLKKLVEDAQRLNIFPANMCHRFDKPFARAANRIDMIDFVITILLKVLQV